MTDLVAEDKLQAVGKSEPMFMSKVVGLLTDIRHELRSVIRLLSRSVPVRLDQIIEGASAMGDITKSVGSTVHSVPVEKNAEGGIIPGLPVPANVKYSIDNPTNGTLVQNADGSADVTGLAAGDVSLSWVDTNEPNIPASVKVLTFTLDNAPASLDQQLS